jgi:3-mercaptopyruvate sulfurtransferase SseA
VRHLGNFCDYLRAKDGGFEKPNVVDPPLRRSTDRHESHRSFRKSLGLLDSKPTASRIKPIYLLIGIVAALLSSCKHRESQMPSVAAAEFAELNTRELLESMGTCKLVDTRLTDAFNGWPLDAIQRGGHIPGAVDFSARWLDMEHPEKNEVLTAALTAKGITPDKHIVLYDTTGSDRLRVARFLRQKGFRNLSLYHLNDWTNDPNLSMERYPRYHLLVPPIIVKSLLDGDRPETFAGSGSIKFAEVSWGHEKKSYAKGHVPTSFHINTDEVEPPPSYMLAITDILKQFVQKYGFTKDDTVILSDEDNIAAFRMAVILRYIGVQDVRVLNGGFQAWKRSGYEIETAYREPPRSAHWRFGTDIPANTIWIDTYQELLAHQKNTATFALVDNRTWEEHIGKISGYSYHDKKGRIPGSLYGYAGTNGASALGFHRNIDDTMRNANEIQNLWQNTGIDAKNKHLSFMCGSGWRAAEVLFYARVMGFENTSLYSDGWIGWSNNPDNPIETGAPNSQSDPS